jgi:hypothetical protein
METKYVLRCIGFATLEPCNASGQYLRSYDPEAFEGRGYALFTDDINEAKLFDFSVDAIALWKTVPLSKVRREDGEYNRPLTAFNVEVLSVTLNERKQMP